MKYDDGFMSCEVVLKSSDKPFAEYDGNEEMNPERSCFIGVHPGQELQIHLRHSGDWPGLLVDIVIDGENCRIHRNSSRVVPRQPPVTKFIDQVWVRRGNRVQYARMRFDKTITTMPESDIELPNRLQGHEKLAFVKLLLYNPLAVGEHVLPYASAVDPDEEPRSAPEDPTITYTTSLLPVGFRDAGENAQTINSLRSRRRPGIAPFATFTFNYRDRRLLTAMEEKGCLIETSPQAFEYDERGTRKRGREDWEEAYGWTYQGGRSSVNAPTQSGTSSNNMPLGAKRNRHTVDPNDDIWYSDRRGALGDGYGPKSLYNQCESTSRRPEEDMESIRHSSTAHSRQASVTTTSKATGTSSAATSPLPTSKERQEFSTTAITATLVDTLPTNPMAMAPPATILNPASRPSLDPRRPQPQPPILETPASPPPSFSGSDFDIDIGSSPGEPRDDFREMPFFRYTACFTSVVIPAQFIADAPENRKMMAIEKLREVLEKEEEHMAKELERAKRKGKAWKEEQARKMEERRRRDVERANEETRVKVKAEMSD